MGRVPNVNALERRLRSLEAPTWEAVTPAPGSKVQAKPARGSPKRKRKNLSGLQACEARGCSDIGVDEVDTLLSFATLTHTELTAAVSALLSRFLFFFEEEEEKAKGLLFFV
jgi:hypothetical protein